MNRYKVALLLMLICSNVFSANEYSVSFKDGSTLTKFLYKNKLMQDFYKTSLYQGLFYRSSAVFNLVDKNGVNWQGKLLGFFSSQILKNNQVDILYFRKKGIHSPFVLKISKLGDAEKVIVAKLLETFKQKSQKFENKDKSYEIYSLLIQNYRIAVTLHDSNLYISRSVPLIKEMFQINDFKMKNDFEVRIENKYVAPGLHPFLSRFYGIKDNFVMGFKWEENKNRFYPNESIVASGSRLNFVNQKIDLNNFSFLPLNSFININLYGPLPVDWSPKNVKKYLKNPSIEKESVSIQPLSFVHWGRLDDGSKKLFLNSLILPLKDAEEKTLVEFDKVFNETQLFEAKFTAICNKRIAVTTIFKAIQLLNSYCRDQKPSIKAENTEIKKFYTEQETIGFGSIDLAYFLSKTFDYEWGRDNHAKNKPEYKETMEFINKIPKVIFRLLSKDDVISIEGKY